jgi:hypothetical protein
MGPEHSEDRSHQTTNQMKTMHKSQRPSDDTPRGASWRAAGLFMVRYGIAAAMVLAGIVALIAVGGDTGTYGFASAVGAGLAVLLLNLLYRLSVSSDRDRDREEAARRYLDEHGVWPDDEDAPNRTSGRRWTLPAGTLTAEQEERERSAAAVRRASVSVMQSQ